MTAVAEQAATIYRQIAPVSNCARPAQTSECRERGITRPEGTST